MNNADHWGRLFGAAVSISATGRRTVAMLCASQDIIAARAAIMTTAAARPLTVDNRELARIVPEKIEAFSRAGSAASAVLLGQGAAWIRYGQDVTHLMLRGRPPTARETAGLHGRWIGLMVGSVEAGARLASVTLAPLQRQVGINARRLASRPSP